MISVADFTVVRLTCDAQSGVYALLACYALSFVEKVRTQSRVDRAAGGCTGWIVVAV